MSFKRLVLLLLSFTPVLTYGQYTKIRNGVWKGTASYYHNMFEGRKTANGEIFRQKKLTGANNFLKLGTRVRVTNLKNGRSIVVKINDRMNKRMKRLIDLSRESARQLGFIHAGLTQVRMEIIGSSNNKMIAQKKKPARTKKIPYVTQKKIAYQPPKVKKKKKAIQAIPYVTQKKISYQKPKVKKVKTTPSKTKAKKVAYQKTKPKPKPKSKKNVVKVSKPSVKKKKLSVKNATTKKVSRYHNQKRELESKRKKESILSWMPQSDKSWISTLSYYQKSYAKESAFIEGGPLSFLDNGQILKSFLKPNNSSEYAFVLLSKHLQTPSDFMIEPIDSATHEPIKDKVLVDIAPRFSKNGDHFIYYFTYNVPEGTKFLRFTMNGIQYENAQSDDFALFIFDE